MTAKVSFRAVALRPLIYLLALVAAAFLWTWARARGADALDATFLAGGTLALAGVTLWLLREGYWEAMDARALRKANAGLRRQGDWVAVAGRAVALESEIRAPLSNRPALACSYRILEKFVGGTKPGSNLSLRLRGEGYHLAPTGLDTGAGIVPLRGLPDLVNLEKSGVGAGGRSLEQAGEPRAWYPPRYAARAHLAAQVSDRFHVDWQYPSRGKRHSIACREWVLSPGERVCIFGRWDGEALVPALLRPRGLPVHAGPPADVAARLAGGAKVFLILAAIPLAGAGWLLWQY